MPIEVRQLEALLAVIDEGGVTAAARKLRLSPGAVTLQIQGLSSHLRTDLFVKCGKRLKPTPAGLRVAEQARGTIGKLREIVAESENDAERDVRPLHFA